MSKETKNAEIIMFGRGFTILVFEEGEHLVKQGVDYVRFTEAYTVRVWGTSNGIGELAAKGPLNSTIIDAIPFSICIPCVAIHMRISVSEDANFKAACDQALKNLL